MSTIADLLIKVRADTKSAEGDLKGLGSRVGSGLGKALVPATLALGAMGVIGKAAFENLQDGANNAKQTEAVLKSTGDASHVTAQHVDDLAMSLRKKAGVDDDVVHSGENMLLTFTNVRNEAGKGNDVFDQATKTMLDMSHALGQDTKSSAIQLGKALNDPIKGVSALQRVGVSFTEDQKKQIKTLVDSGHAMDAQKLILHELNKEFGGSAENIDPTTKAIANMKLDAVDLASSLLSSLMPALQTFVGILQAATGFMTEHEHATKILVGVIAGLAVGVIAANVAMKLYAAGAVLMRAVTAAWTAAQWLLNAALEANPIGIVIIALVALGAAFVVLWTKCETFRNIVTGAWNAIKSATVTVWNFIKEHLAVVVAALLIVLTGGLGLVVAAVIMKWDAIKGATEGAWNAIKGAVSSAVGAVRGAITGGFNAAEGAVTGSVNAIEGAVRRVFGSLDNIVRAAVGAVRSAVGSLAGAFQPVLSILETIVGGADRAMGAIDSVLGKLGSVGSAVGKAEGLLHHIPGFAGGVRNFAGGLALVGENGPELVNLPGGSSVFTNGESRRMMVGNSGPLIGHVTVQNEVDVEVLARRVARLLAFQS